MEKGVILTNYTKSFLNIKCDIKRLTILVKRNKHCVAKLAFNKLRDHTAKCRLQEHYEGRSMLKMIRGTISAKL